MTHIGIVLNSTIVNEHEFLIQFESIIDAKETSLMLKIVLYNNAPLRKYFINNTLWKTMWKGKMTYMYGWKLGNYNENPDILIPSNGIHNGIQTVLKCVNLKKRYMLCNAWILEMISIKITVWTLHIRGVGMHIVWIRIQKFPFSSHCDKL